MNLSFFIRQISLIMLLTAGVSLEMIGGVIDLAFAAQLSASAFLGIGLIFCGFPVWAGFIGIFLFNALTGVLKAAFFVKWKVPSVIFTLAIQVITANFLAGITDNKSIVLRELQGIRQEAVWMWIELVTAFLCMLCVYVFLERTYYGKYCRMLGEDLQLAEENGVKCFGISVVVHLFASLFFSISAVFLMVRTGSSNSSLGATYLYLILTAVFLGGMLPNTGKGRVFGMLSGSLAVTLAVTFLTGKGLLYRWENILEGSVILLVLVLGVHRKSRKSSP